jgi:hypothetical protein
VALREGIGRGVNRLIVQAAANAQKGADLIVGLTFEERITEETGEAVAIDFSSVESLVAYLFDERNRRQGASRVLRASLKRGCTRVR